MLLCLQEHRAHSETEPRSALCFSLWWLSEPQCVFCIHKKPSVWLTLNCLSLLEVPVCLHPTRVTKIVWRRERMCKKCTFSTEIGISRLESCKAFTYQIIAHSFGGKQCNIWFFSALNHLVFLSMQVRSSAAARNWITARFCLCVCFIPYDSSIYSFFWGANNDE